MAIPINGNMLAAVRQQRRLSQQELADRRKIGIATIKRIERTKGTSSYRVHTADCLAKALEVQVEDLSEDRFLRVIDLGSDVEFHLDRIVDVDKLRLFQDWVIKMTESRNRILKD